MDPKHVILVKNTWAIVVPNTDKAAKILYDKVFELDPPLRALFTGDMTKQGRKIMSMIDSVVNSLDRHNAVFPAVEELGRQHLKYGVKDKDYNTLRTALLWTLETLLGNEFIPEIKEAWTIVYNQLIHAMKNAALAA